MLDYRYTVGISLVEFLILVWFAKQSNIINRVWSKYNSCHQIWFPLPPRVYPTRFGWRTVQLMPKLKSRGEGMPEVPQNTPLDGPSIFNSMSWHSDDVNWDEARLKPLLVYLRGNRNLNLPEEWKVVFPKRIWFMVTVLDPKVCQTSTFICSFGLFWQVWFGEARKLNYDKSLQCFFWVAATQSPQVERASFSSTMPQDQL